MDDLNPPGTSGNSSLDFGSVFGSLKDLLNGKNETFGTAGQIGAFLGLGALANRLGSSAPQTVGYQGRVPLYVAQRQQTPLIQQRPAGYRPGQGGITYFTPVQYQDTGIEPRRAQEFAAPPAPAPAAPPGNAAGGFMQGGLAALAAGGHTSRYLRGPGDGVSDDIKARFADSGEEARLADGEFVIDARTVSEIGNGSSEAGARKLYEMLDRIHAMRKRAARGKPSGADRELNKLIKGIK